jgi:hypothetical protein
LLYSTNPSLQELLKLEVISEAGRQLEVSIPTNAVAQLSNAMRIQGLR